MKIISVSVRTRDAVHAATFYEDILDLPVERSPDGVTVTVGATLLRLVEDPEAEGDHHFAITIPSNKLLEGKKWLQGRTDLLGAPGPDEFECPPAWNARSLYFWGPDDSILEFIIRRDLANATQGPFTGSDLLCVSEVGIAVPDVPATAARLNDDAQIASYGGAPGAAFAPMGDATGLLILVEPGRVWFPTENRVARQSQIAITATGGRPGDYPLGSFSSLSILPRT